MAQRSSITQLPAEIKAAIDQRLIGSSFSGYRDLSEWLQEQGYILSKSALHRYGKSFEDRLSSLKLSHDFAIAYKQALPDDQGARAEVLTDLAQDTLFNLMLQLQKKAQDLEGADEEDGGLIDLSNVLSKVTRAISDVNRSGISVKKYASEVKDRLDAKFQALEGQASKGGLDAETLRKVREEIYGLV